MRGASLLINSLACSANMRIYSKCVYLFDIADQSARFGATEVSVRA